MLNIATNISRFRPGNRSRRKLPFPAAAQQRIAQIGAVARVFDLAQPFPPERWNDLETFQPQMLVGSASDLLHLSRLSQPGGLDLSCVDHALFVLTHCGRNPLTDVMRVSLWQAFGVPLFELFIGSRGRLLASECEAHEGWHAEPGNHFFFADGKLIVDEPSHKGAETGLTAELDHTLCPCGREGLRLLNIDGQAAFAAPQALAAIA